MHIQTLGLPAPSRRQRVVANRSTSRAGAARHFIRRTFKSAADSANLTGSITDPKSASLGPSFCLMLSSQPTTAGTNWGSLTHSAIISMSDRSAECSSKHMQFRFPSELPLSLHCLWEGKNILPVSARMRGLI